jgi:hypothetical protein
MANLYFNKKNKASQEDAKRSLMQYIAKVWEGRFTVDFWSDDGGNLIRAVLELDDPGQPLEGEFRLKFPPVWEGWRMVVLKVPTGHVDVFWGGK